MLILTLITFCWKLKAKALSTPLPHVVIMFFICFSGIHGAQASENPLPPIHVTETTPDTTTELTENMKIGEEEKATTVIPLGCEAESVRRSLQAQFSKMKRELESGYQSGLPAKLKNQLVEIRTVNDQLSSQILNSTNAAPQEIQALIQMSLDHIDRFIEIIPTLTAQAPQVLEDLVLPLTNFENENNMQECIATSPNAPHLKTMTSELERLNSQLFIVQSLAPQKFIAYKLELQKLLNLAMDKDPEFAKEQFQAQMPMVINTLQLEVDKVLPTFVLSAEYTALAL